MSAELRVSDGAGGQRIPTRDELALILEEERLQFEKRCYASFYIKSVKFKPNEQFATPTNTTPEELFARDPEKPDHYADDHIDAMWFGWKLCIDVR